MKDKMNVVAVTDKEKVEILESDMPHVGPQDVLVKLRACTLCTFEQRIFRRVVNTPLPFVPGHEIVGEIAAIGADVNEKEYPLHHKVVVRLLHACGECYYCRRGEENLCTHRNEGGKGKMAMLGMGGLGQYLSVEKRSIWMVDDQLSDDVAVFSEPLSCVVNSVERGQIQLGDDVVVIGGGIMGQLHILLAKLSGARVVLSEPDQERRALALRLGCDEAFDSIAIDPVAHVKELTGGRGAEVVFNTTAVSSVAKQAVAMTAPLGRCIMYSSQHPDVPFEVSANDIHNSQIVLTGAVSPTVRSFDRAVNLLNKGLVDPLPLLVNSYDYHDAQKAFEEAIKPQTMRIAIRFTED